MRIGFYIRVFPRDSEQALATAPARLACPASTGDLGEEKGRASHHHSNYNLQSDSFLAQSRGFRALVEVANLPSHKLRARDACRIVWQLPGQCVQYRGRIFVHAYLAAPQQP